LDVLDAAPEHQLGRSVQRDGDEREREVGHESSPHETGIQSRQPVLEPTGAVRSMEF
jgi:hypothetical protein